MITVKKLWIVLAKFVPNVCRFASFRIMQLGMFRIISKQHKIFRSIIISNSVNMMNDFIRFKKSAYFLFHNKSASFNVLVSIPKRMVRRISKNISLMFNFTFKIRVQYPFFKATRIRFHNTLSIFVPGCLTFFKLRIRRNVFSLLPGITTFLRTKKLAFYQTLLNIKTFLTPPAIFKYSALFHVTSFFIIISFIFSLSTCSATTQWRNGDGSETVLGSINPGTIDSAIYDNIVAPLDNFLADGRFGCKLAYSSASELTVGIGSVVCSNTSGSIRLMARNSSATTVDWDDIDTGSEAASTTYYVYAVMSAVSDTTFTIKVSESSSLPSGVTYYLRLGSFYNDTDSDISSVADDTDFITPTGIISLWYGTTSNIPSGWVLCDGDNGTPDLTDKFILGAGNLATAGSSRSARTLAGSDSSITYLLGAGALAVPGSSTVGVSPNQDVMPPYYALLYIMKI